MQTTAQDYADLLKEWHSEKAPFRPLPDQQKSMTFAVAVQDASIARWTDEGRDIAGWKIGLTSQRMQEMCGVTEPVYGAIIADLVRRGSADLVSHLDSTGYGRLGLEMELAVRLSRVPAEDEPYTAETILPLVADIAAAFEIIDDRSADYAVLDACSLVADNSWNQGVILGEPNAPEAGQPLTGRRGVLRRNGEEISSGMSEDAGGDPLAVVAWLVGALRQRGRQLLPGEWIMTGSLIPTIFPQAGEHYSFEIEGLAPVGVSVL